MARILALTCRIPYPPREGHQLRSFHLLRALASAHRVHLLSCARRDDALAETGPLRDMLAGFETFAIPVEHSRLALGGTLAASPFSPLPFTARKFAIPALRKRVTEIVRDFDLVHIDMLPLMTYSELVPPHMPLVLNAHNVEHALLERRLEIETGTVARTFLRGQVPRLHRFEIRACQRAGAVLACSRTDAEQLQTLAPATPVHIVPNGVDLAFNHPAADPPAQPAQLVFVGQTGWFPNRDGVEWFFAEVLPRIVAARPDANFMLIGKCDNVRIPANLSAHVRLAGFVTDVRPLIRESAVYVVPLRAGSGTRLKILEAMALGKAIVSTTIGAEGIGLEHGAEALLADTAGAFVGSVLHLLESPHEIARLGVNARARAERRYGWETIGADLLAHYAHLLANASSA